MHEAEFRRRLAARHGERSIASYVAYCRRVEREAQVDLDACDLSEAGIGALGSRLRAAGMNAKSVSNCLSALRAYAGLEPKHGRMSVTREQRERWAASTASSPFNRWLDGQVRDADGRLDLERLHALAAGFGVDRRQAYAHLNPGQQRMNLGNVLRGIVPVTLYAGEADGEAAALSSPQADSPRDPPAVGRDVREASVGALLSFYGEIMEELRFRGVVRTGNSPVGDYAELLFATAFGWSLAPNSAAGHDAEDAAGLRYQIKGRRLGAPTASRQLSAIRRLPERSFDQLAAVLLDSRFKVLRAAIIPHALVEARARRVEHTNSWTILLDDRVWRQEGVRDVTAEIAVAAARL